MPEPTTQQKSLIRRLWKEHESQLENGENEGITGMLPVTTSGEASRLVRMLLALPTPPEVLEAQATYVDSLRCVVDKLDSWQATFANSVIGQHDSGKALSQKQIDAIKRITKLTIRTA